jgi:hypothetical protein
MDATERFAAEVAAPAGKMRLDVAGCFVWPQAHPGLDVDRECGRPDALGIRSDADVRRHARIS